MFRGCTALTAAPELPATTLAKFCYDIMFGLCTSLTTPPELPATTLASYCYSEMFYGCTSLKLSTTQTEKYTIPYRIPSSGTGATSTNSLFYMFIDTGGTFTGTPEINTTYYLYDTRSTPTTITYKGQQLAEIDSGSKTLKCSGKYMEDDIVVYREKGTAAISYNGATIATVTDGTKTLKCAGKLMAGDVIVKNE